MTALRLPPVASQPEEREVAHALLSPAALGAAAQAFILSRLILAGVTVIACIVLRQSPLVLWNQWDSTWYLGIAQHGYHWVLPGHHASSFAGATLAFFPLLPLLLRLGELAGVPGILFGLLLVNAAYFGALVYAYHLLAAHWGESAARRGLLIMALFPTAFFTAAPYTEPLFLLGATGALYHADRRQPAAAGIWLAVAILARSTGIIAVVPALMLLHPGRIRDWLLALGPTLACWAAFLLYLAGQGVPLGYLISAQRAWHRGLTFPWTGFTASLLWLAQHLSRLPWLAVENVGDMIATVLFLGLTAAAWKDLSLPWRVYCAGFWLLVLCSPEWQDSYAVPFSSMDRFILALFPLAAWAATRNPGSRLRRTLMLSSAVMAIVCAVHITGGWIG